MTKRQRDSDSIADSDASTEEPVVSQNLQSQLDKSKVKLQKMFHVLRMIDDCTVFGETAIRHMIKFTLDELDDLDD